MFPFFQSLGTSPDCHDLWNIMESGLAMTSANSLRTLGCISSGPTDLRMCSGCLGDPERGLPLQWEGLYPSRPHLAVYLRGRGEERSCQWRLRQKMLLSTLAFSSVGTRLPFLFIRWGMLSLNKSRMYNYCYLNYVI